MSFNMVESNKNLTREELEKQRTGIAMSVVLDIERFELSGEFDYIYNWERIKNFVYSSNDEVLQWFLRKKHYSEIDEDTSWYDFKIMFKKRFGPQDVTTIRRLARWEKKPEEGIRDFVERIDAIGIELGMGNKHRHEMIKEKLRKANIDRDIKAVIRLFRFNEENSLNRLNQYELWQKLQEEKRSRYLKQQEIKINNSIEDSNKVVDFEESYIEINNTKQRVLFDTGAHFNFMNEETARKISANIVDCQPETFRTCLGESFTIRMRTRVNFSFKNQKFEEYFYILPKRQGHCILIGLEWINKFKTSYKEDLKKKINLIECEINSPQGSKVVEVEYRIPQALESKVLLALEKLLEKGYVRPSTSTFLNNIRPVEKPDGSIRITCNFIALNKLVELDKYTLPRMDEMIHKLRDQMWFSKVDLKDGFFQIPLRECDRFKTAFRVKNRLYEWNVMPMGFKNSPAIFQRNMDKLFHNLIGKACFIYVDDILVFGKTEEEHDNNLKKVLEILNMTKLVINKDKSIFKVKQVEFLGNIIQFNEILPGLKKDQAIAEYPTPKDKDEVRRFMGIVNYYRKFIPDCATKSENLLKLMRKDVEFHWGKQEESTFQNLKDLLMSPKVLAQPDFNKPFILETDASNIGLGAILSQEFNGDVKPIAFASRKLGSSERNYSISEKEMLAGLWGMENFEYFIYGREFKWITDHKALEALNTKGIVQSARIERWADRINKFKFTVVYKKGEELSHVDAFSRIEEIKKFENNQPMVIENQNVEISEDERKIIMNKHEDLVHRGSQIVHEELKKEYNWKNMGNKVKTVLKDCIKCKMYNPLRNSGYKYVETFEVGEKLGYDIMGPIENRYIVVAIDYFSRKGFAKVLHSRGTKGILKFLEEIYTKIPFKCLVSDNAKENVSKEIKEWLNERNINCHFTTAYHHESNGRVERLNRTITEGINKISMKGLLTIRLKKVLDVYNNVRHSAIGISPNEAMDSTNWNDIKKRIFERQVSRYMKRFKNKEVAHFKDGDEILIKNEKYREKKDPKFDTSGVIKKDLDNKTYLVEKGGKIIKKHYDQLRIM